MNRVGIIGGGISAQIAALAAASARCEVTLFEAGTGYPKLSHAHLLLAGSWQALLELAPDVTFDLGIQNFFDTTRDWSFHSAIGKITTRPCHLSTPVLSAEHLLAILRAAVSRRPNVSIQPITADDMTDLLKKPSDIPYFLATGMLTPLTTVILRRFTGHTLERIKNAKHSVYSSFNFQLRASDIPRWRVKIRDLRCDGKNGLLAQIFENGIALVSVVSAGPIRTITELTRFLRNIDEPDLGDTLSRSELNSPIKWHRFPGTLRRITSVLDGWQPNMFLFGDTAMSTDPYFGHGIFLAAVQGLALKEALSGHLSKSHGQRLDIFRARQDYLLSECLALQDKIGSPHVMRKAPTIIKWRNLACLHMFAAMRRQFIRKIHMIEFLEKIKFSWSNLNEEESTVSRLSCDEIILSSVERLIPKGQARPIVGQHKRGAAMDGWSV